MTESKSMAGHRLYHYWQKLHKKPFGTWFFNRIFAFNVPYSATIKARIQILKPGYCEVLLPYRRRNTNHLNSVHALATANLGEMTGGLAMLSGLPETVRGIVTRINIEYLKKARGDLIGKADVTIPTVIEDKTEYQVQSHIYDQAGDEVTCVTVTWLLSPTK